MQRLGILLLVFCLFSCTQDSVVTRGMYFWKVNQKMTQKDTRFLLDNNIRHYYIRFFDVGWSDALGAIPKGLLNEKSRNKKQDYKFKILSESLHHENDISIIPVVYIENVVMKNIAENNIHQLVDKIYRKIKEIHEIEFPHHPINEIQIDCDWSDKTKANYFKFLEKFKEKNKDGIISVTIRLHQVKYPEITGIPPVKKGTLMYYNMGKVRDFSEENSILNNEIGKQYIDEKTKYPLELNVALPVYSWSVWFNDAGGFNKLLYSINAKNINNFDFLKLKNNNYYSCGKDTVLLGNYFRKGDMIRLEEQNIETIREAKKICASILKKRKKEIIIFSYSPENSKLINYENLNSIYSFD